MQRLELSRNEVAAHIYKSHGGFKFAAKVAGSTVAEGQHDELDQVRNHLCYVARNLGSEAQAKNDPALLRRAAMLFNWAREARL